MLDNNIKITVKPWGGGVNANVRVAFVTYDDGVLEFRKTFIIPKDMSNPNTFAHHAKKISAAFDDAPIDDLLKQAIAKDRLLNAR